MTTSTIRIILHRGSEIYSSLDEEFVFDNKEVVEFLLHLLKLRMLKLRKKAKQ